MGVPTTGSWPWVYDQNDKDKRDIDECRDRYDRKDRISRGVVRGFRVQLVAGITYMLCPECGRGYRRVLDAKNCCNPSYTPEPITAEAAC